MYGQFTKSQLPHCLMFFASHKVYYLALRTVLATESIAFLVSLFAIPKSLIKKVRMVLFINPLVLTSTGKYFRIHPTLLPSCIKSESYFCFSWSRPDPKLTWLKFFKFVNRQTYFKFHTRSYILKHET